MSNLATVTRTKKEWWQRPEKWANFAGIGVLGLIAFYFADSIMPMVHRVMQLAFQSALYALGTSAILVFMTWIIMSNRLHELVWLGYDSLMRYLTNLIIRIDPISVMQGYVGKLRKNRGEAAEAIGKLRGILQDAIQDHQKTTEEYEHSMNMASQAQKKGSGSALQVYSRKAERREKASIKEKAFIEGTTRHIARLSEILESIDYMILDIDDTIKSERDDRKRAFAKHAAMSAMQRVLANNAERERFDAALQINADDCYARLGEVEQFMEDTKILITTTDLENGFYEEKVLQRLEAWDKRKEPLLVGGTGNTKFQVESKQLPGTAGDSSSAYSDIFNQ